MPQHFLVYEFLICKRVHGDKRIDITFLENLLPRFLYYYYFLFLFCFSFFDFYSLFLQSPIERILIWYFYIIDFHMISIFFSLYYNNIFLGFVLGSPKNCYRNLLFMVYFNNNLSGVIIIEKIVINL